MHRKKTVSFVHSIMQPLQDRLQGGVSEADEEKHCIIAEPSLQSNYCKNTCSEQTTSSIATARPAVV